MELDAGAGAWCGARILQCRAMPDLNAVQRESGGTRTHWHGAVEAPQSLTGRPFAILQNRFSRLRFFSCRHVSRILDVTAEL